MKSQQEPSKSIQKQRYIKWIDMEQWHISPKEQTTTVPGKNT